jgi:hypothetical protein
MSAKFSGDKRANLFYNATTFDVVGRIVATQAEIAGSIAA